MIGLIQNKMGDAAGVKGTTIHQILQTSRRCHNNIDTAAQATDLRVIAGAAKYRDMPDIEISRQLLHIL